MDINPSEITKILKEQIKNLGDKYIPWSNSPDDITLN